MRLEGKELYNLNGGGITATMLNSIARLINSVLDLGRTVGSSISRIISKNYC